MLSTEIRSRGRDGQGELLAQSRMLRRIALLPLHVEELATANVVANRPLLANFEADTIRCSSLGVSSPTMTMMMTVVVIE